MGAHKSGVMRMKTEAPEHAARALCSGLIRQICA